QILPGAKKLPSGEKIQQLEKKLPTSYYRDFKAYPTPSTSQLP
ncbi:hypothetical protein A2U01_0119437, partial [Trifolium medium]|nr:hypothetical protein [Trifolium medium]